MCVLSFVVEAKMHILRLLFSVDLYPIALAYDSLQLDE
jgi:hypothetical protein